MALPTGVGTGTINGRFVLGVIDSPYDEDNDPELIPAQGRITFVPNIPYDPYVPDAIDGVPMTILRASISGVLDSEGYLCTPDNTSASGFTRGVKLFSTDTGMVTNWTYTVKYSFSSVNNVSGIIPDHPLSVPNGSIQDLTTIVRVPSSPGVGIPQMEAAVLRAESVARSVREDADAGVFDGDKGDVGPMGPPVALEIGTVSASAGNPADDDIMSTLILSGTKTQAAIKAQIPIEQIGAQGPKGDPGGFVNATMISGSVHCDTLNSGIYFRATTVDGVDTGFPQTNSGLVRAYYVQESNKVQEYVPMPWNSQAGRIYWTRHRSGTGDWGAWVPYCTTRTDRTVGTATYLWDEVTQADRLISGDTGEIDVSHLLSNGWELLQPAGAMYIQRVGNTVSLRLRNMNGDNATSDIFLTDLPVGFRPRSGNNRMPIVVGASTSVSNSWALVRSYERDVRIPRTAGTIGTQYDYIEISWTTPDAWPTALPEPQHNNEI